jgi:hypothetical protein
MSNAVIATRRNRHPQITLGALDLYGGMRFAGNLPFASLPFEVEVDCGTMTMILLVLVLLLSSSSLGKLKVYMYMDWDLHL